MIGTHRPLTVDAGNACGRAAWSIRTAVSPTRYQSRPATDDCRWSSIDLDLDELAAIKATRALTDPVIVHEPTKDWALPEGHDIYRHVRLARLRQNMATSLDERIEYATWPETVAYLSTASMDGRMVGRELKEAYQHSLREYLDRWTPLDPDEQAAPIDEDPSLDEYHRERLQDLRFGIKKDRDRHFVEHRYDDLDIDGVPKAFWLTGYEQDSSYEELDEYSQSALEDFTG